MGRTFLSICGLIMALALAASAKSPDDQGTGQPRQAADDPVAAARMLDGERKGDDGTSQAADEANEIARSDLTAQWTMTALSVAQLIMTAMGLWFIYKTLEATREALRDTSQATAAMQEANAIARQIGTAQTRPYLILDVANIEVMITTRGISNIFVRVPMKNYGNTPAIDPNVAINCWGGFGNGPGMKPYSAANPLTRNVHERGTTIGPGESYRGIWPTTVIDREIEEPLWKRHLPQFSLLPAIKDETSYPAYVHIDVLFTYADLEGNVLGGEYYRLDATLPKKDEFAPCSVLRVRYDPQGAGDIYEPGFGSQ